LRARNQVSSIQGLFGVQAQPERYHEKNEATLAKRIASIIGREVLVAPSRQGVSICKPDDAGGFVAKIRAVSIEKLKSVVPLSAQEFTVLRQVHTPNEQPRVFCWLDADEREIDPATGKVLPPKMTARTIAEAWAWIRRSSVQS
jgi:hypothetical protein